MSHEARSILSTSRNNQTQPRIRPSITRLNRRFSRCSYQHTARVILPTLKRVSWKTLYLEIPRKSGAQGTLTER